MLARKNFVLFGWIAAAFVVGAIAWAATASPSFQKCMVGRSNVGQNAQAPAKNRSTIGGFWEAVECEGAFLDANSVLLIAIATIVIAAYAWEANERQLATAAKLADAAQQAVKAAEHALTIGRRAFVSFKQVTPGRVIDSNTKTVKYWVITPIFENSGETPTKDLVGSLNYGFFDGAPANDFDFPDKHRENDSSAKIAQTRILLAPKSAANIGGSIFIGVERMQELAKRTRAFYFWGWIDYNDIFPGTPRHRTEFCIQIVVEGDPSKISDDGVPGCRIVTQYYRRHNAADEECSRPPQPHGVLPQDKGAAPVSPNAAW